MKVAVIGSVASTALLVEKLAAHGFEHVAVYGVEEARRAAISGYADLGELAAAHGYAHRAFRKVAEIEDEVVAMAPDLLFVVGISQLVSARLIGAARRHAIGFHPTRLPEGRGRAAIAWLVLEKKGGAASFFELGEGMDDGAILAQEPFDYAEGDDARAIYDKLLAAEAVALDRLLPALRDGTVEPAEQDHSRATYYAVRKDEDGVIDWTAPATAIVSLVAAAAAPHPGASTHGRHGQIRLWQASVDPQPVRGVPGRIVAVGDDGFSVACGDGLVRIERWTGPDKWKPVVGVKLGRDHDAEIDRLRAQVEALEARLARLEER